MQLTPDSSAVDAGTVRKGKPLEGDKSGQYVPGMRCLVKILMLATQSSESDGGSVATTPAQHAALAGGAGGGAGASSAGASSAGVSSSPAASSSSSTATAAAAAAGAAVDNTGSTWPVDDGDVDVLPKHLDTDVHMDNNGNAYQGDGDVTMAGDEEDDHVSAHGTAAAGSASVRDDSTEHLRAAEAEAAIWTNNTAFVGPPTRDAQLQHNWLEVCLACVDRELDRDLELELELELKP